MSCPGKQFFRSFSTSTVQSGKRNFRNFILYNRGSNQFRKQQEENPDKKFQITSNDSTINIRYGPEKRCHSLYISFEIHVIVIAVSFKFITFRSNHLICVCVLLYRNSQFFNLSPNDKIFNFFF